jgi:hypothetical protein
MGGGTNITHQHSPPPRAQRKQIQTQSKIEQEEAAHTLTKQSALSLEFPKLFSEFYFSFWSMPFWTTFSQSPIQNNFI